MKNPNLTPMADLLRSVTRRHFFRQFGFGVGAAALANLINPDLFASEAIDEANPLAPRPPHYPAKAKSIIFLSMPGAPSQLDMFDFKPKLCQMSGQNCPEEYLKNERFAFIRGVPKLLGTPHSFRQHGQAGVWLSNLLPSLAQRVDDLTFIYSMTTSQFNHAPAQIFQTTGHQIPGRPSMGSWLTYGLGSEARELPGFVVLISGENQPDGGKACWSSGFVPSVYQGVEFRSKGDPVLFLTNPEGVSPETRRASLDLLRDLNQQHLTSNGDPEIATRIASYEMAYKMQSSVPELTDISKEPEHIHKLYGTEPGAKSFANNCLLARRLVERGVRFVQLYHRGWDNHGVNAETDIVQRLPRLCREIDQASAALIQDLKQRGLLDSTLVVWGGEFGRTPMNEERDRSKFLGRDHHARAFTMWLAGGGIKPGVSYGKTDDLGYNVAEDPVDVHDLHATMLHLMGIDHTKLTYKFQGRQFRLTDVSGNILHKILV
jgi:hypothetical protein